MPFSIPIQCQVKPVRLSRCLRGGAFSSFCALVLLVVFGLLNWLAVDYSAHAKFHELLGATSHLTSESHDGVGSRDGDHPAASARCESGHLHRHGDDKGANHGDADADAEDHDSSCVITLLAQGQLLQLQPPDSQQAFEPVFQFDFATVFVSSFCSGPEFLPFSCGPPA